VTIPDMKAAYAAQAALVQRLCGPPGARPAGYKIGLTAPRMQAMCGVDQPIAGVVLASRIHRSGAVIAASRYNHLGIEFEIGVRFGRDLQASAPLTIETVAAAVDGVCAAVELIDDDHADYKKFDLLACVAENAWNAGIVLGEFAASWGDLAAAEGIAYRDGAEFDRGFGRDALGHPFASLAWLAAHLAAAGGGLRRGDVVLTGSIVPTLFPKPGEAYRFAVAGVGAVHLTIAG
jgi:2-oxo-3-hexenedioate decarboxylase/2-keto-4-pentenoate hydratase